MDLQPLNSDREQPIEVDPSCVERELRGLWARTGLAEGPTIVRVCALNLVVVLWQQDGPSTTIEAVATDVATQHPARALIVRADPRPDGSDLRSWVSVRCDRRIVGGLRACHEEIRMDATGKAVRHLDNVILQNLVADRPTFLWWNGPLPDTPEEEIAFGALVETTDRLVVDSQHLVCPETDLVALAHFARSPELRAALGDLNWHRLTAWRQLLARCYDPPDMRPLLANLDRVVIGFETGPAGVAPAFQALLLLGWLASRLGWTIDDVGAREGGGCTWRFRQGSRLVEARLEQNPSRCADGTCIHEIACDHGTGRVRIHHASPTTLENVIERQGEAPRSEAVHLPSSDLATVLMRELSIMGRNPIFEGALAMAEHLFTLHHAVQPA